MNLWEQQTFIKNEYPSMPQEIRDMIETEVKAQMENKTTIDSGKNYNKKPIMKYIKAASVGLVLGAVTVGGCVTAHQLHMLSSQKTGNYSVAVKMENGSGSADTVNNNAKSSEIIIPKVSMEITGQPKGITFSGLEEGSGKILAYKDGKSSPAASIYVFSLTDGSESFNITDKNVLNTEELSINGNPVSYLDLSYVNSDSQQTTSKIYMVFPKLNHMVMIYGLDGIEKEEMLSLAKGIKLSKADDGAEAVCHAMPLKAGETPFASTTDSEVFESEDGTAAEDKTFASSEEFLSNLHKIGDEVSIENDTEKVTVKLNSVKVCSNLSEVPSGLYDHPFGADIKNKCDDEGNFISEELQYVNRGNGVDSVDEVVKNETVKEKLVVIAFEYTNKSDTDISEYCFNPGELVTVRKSNGGYEIYNYDSLAKQAGVDAVIGKNYNNNGICNGWDNGGGNTRKNEIVDFKAGETRTVYSAFFVNTDQLSDIYLDILSGFEYNGAFGYGDYNEPLEAGYFDIRQ